ncbi:omega-3 polyunsaturated fatty acid synthase subunit, PfaC [Rhodococcus wratislaviensis]|uniref:Omega-3 polyunsaturated fatty acid synthase subunit, PfaC n=1 Tax=Rhodococcus wratislaviensis TaxID=44752 RepID=A0A402CMU2_RHOWR|nr:beta-ketoacyl synthase [Rhodococcus wratislaviensis]GCE44865.1 omega-3 polyunsaturated fatty acid synthase subunit, PfaC [Rhodococcus wratislaviensis]
MNPVPTTTPDVLSFDGVAFNPVPISPTITPTTIPAPVPSTPARALPATAATPLAEVRAGLVAAHRAALAAQTAVQRRLLRDARTITTTTAEVIAPASGGPVAAVTAAPEGAYKPLARTGVDRLDAAALDLLTRGQIPAVFGPAYQQLGANHDIRLAADGSPLLLHSVSEIGLRDGALGLGRLRARYTGNPAAAAVQAGQVFALYAGLHLCLADAHLDSAASATAATDASTESDLELIVTDIDLVPRPHLTAEVLCGGSSVPVSVTVTENPAAVIGPGAGGTLDTWTGRITAAGERALLNEFHMAHLARGDQGIALGPEFAHYTGIRATRVPTGGLLLVDRITDFGGTRGTLDQQLTYRSEYDSPADSWYYADTANESMPHFVYMETSLQAALLMGYYLGPTLTQPHTTQSLRNLGGTATVLRRVELRDKTITQTSRLLSTTLLPGSSLQSFDYTLSADGEPFYQGETMFGYFSDEALSNQTGLDAGRHRPTWLAEHPDRASTRRIDLDARRRNPGDQLCNRRNLALLDWIDVVDGGGAFGNGYLHALRRIDPQDWFFSRHFHLDPVIPGSLGVESVIQALQEWAADTGLADHLADPVFSIPANIAFTWKYRGQFLPSDGTCELEVHIKTVTHSATGVVVTADASLWKPGLRIYELEDIAIELTERKTPA